MTLSKLLPFDVNGSIFTGLSNETTLQVTVKYYVERIPTVSDPDLLVLSRPSPQYDPMAVEIYSRAMSELPVAVAVGENPLGEWFNDVLDTVSEFAPALGSVFGPMGAAAGSTLAAGARTWRNQRQGQVQTQSPSQVRVTPNRPRRPPRPRTIILNQPPNPQPTQGKKKKNKNGKRKLQVVKYM
jgi:hypothetical protein